MEVVYTEREGYLEARLWETDSLDVMKQQVAEILKTCTQRKPPRLLVDMTAFRETLSVIDRYELGTLSAKFSPHVARGAVLANSATIDPEKFGVQVARNRGLTVDIFDDREKALAWLLEPA